MSFTLLNGLAGGFVATVAMTILMMVMGDDSPPPTAQLWSKYLGDQPAENYMMQGMALHFIYGIMAGAVFSVGLPAIGLTPATLLMAAVYGAVYGLVLQFVGSGLWMMTVLGMKPEKKQIVG
ncbi:MAG: hypothetical protein ABEJ03_00025, partial [Candidatus Nanohaloarchaea archaeon]